MPRVTKTKAPVVATPRRATRSTVRAGSASLEEPIEVPAPRRRGSRSKTPESKNSSFEKSQPENHLPALAEEEVEQSPRILLPQPNEVAPIVDASPYVTPQHYHLAAARNTLYTSPTADQSPRTSTSVRSLNKSPAVAQSIHNSPALAQSVYNSPSVSQLIQQSPIGDKSLLHNTPTTTTKSVRSSPAVSRSVHQSPTVTKTVQQTIEIYSDDEDEVQDDYEIQIDNDVAEYDQEDEEAAQEAAASQLAHETAEAGLSQSHLTSPVLLKTPTTASSLAGHSTSKRRRSARSGGFPRTPAFRDIPAFDSTLSEISGNTGWREFFPPEIFKSSSPASPTSPNFSLLMERAMKEEDIITELTSRQSTAVLINMRREILRLRKIEEQFLASQQPQPAAQSPQPPTTIQEKSPEIPRTISRLGDLRYQRTVATPARKRLLAQREAEKAAAAAAAAAEAEKAAEEEEQTPSRSVPSSTSRSRLSSGNSKRKSSQHSTPEAQTPQQSSQNSAPTETPSASPAWGLTSLFGSVKNIFTHRPNFSPIKQIQEQPQEQIQEQPMPQSQQGGHKFMFTPSPAKNPRRFLSSSQQSPTPKPREPAPPATPAPAPQEAEDDGLYGQTPRTTRRRGVLPGSMPRRKRDTPAAKPKEVNADLRASQLALGAQRTVEREQAQEKADRLERERLAIVEELKLRDSAYNVGDKRKMQVNVDDLAVIPRKAAGASSGTYGLLDDFFHYDDDSDIVEMDEDDVQLLPAPEHPTKRVRIDDNVFVPKTPTPAPQPTTTSPVKQVAPQQQPTIPTTTAPNYAELTQQAIEKQRQRFNEHKPKQPSRLRNVERLSTGSTVGASSPQQPITAPLQNIQEVTAPVQATQEVAPVAQLAQAPAPKVINWPELGPPMTTPEGFARADKIYTPELKALDHEFYMRGFANAMANSKY
ncbi:hypothetical protein E4T50_04335 [Aureobasidium sp. EXF-12298]|nr:hypothetical protein E4T50_04335 [Aureobasidium sp. EXF-12298]